MMGYSTNPWNSSRFMPRISIRAQGCVADAHFLLEITEKMVLRGRTPPAGPSFRDFLGTVTGFSHSNFNSYLT
jgi:hypothetical protein